MGAEETEAKVRLADARYREAREQAEAAFEDLLHACAAALRNGAALKDVAKSTGCSPRELRKGMRAHGIRV